MTIKTGKVKQLIWNTIKSMNWSLNSQMFSSKLRHYRNNAFEEITPRVWLIGRFHERRVFLLFVWLDCNVCRTSDIPMYVITVDDFTSNLHWVYTRERKSKQEVCTEVFINNFHCILQVCLRLWTLLDNMN